MVKYLFGNVTEPIPNPVCKFEQAFHQYPEILDEIYKQSFEKPSPIQSQAWPVLLKGKDMIGIAQTGTGKFCWDKNKCWFASAESYQYNLPVMRSVRKISSHFILM